MKKYTKPELDVIEIKASDVFTDSASDSFDLEDDELVINP